MKMTRHRRAILSRLESGPAGTAEICDLLCLCQSDAYTCLSKMAKHGAIRNVGQKWRAKWELVK